MNQGDTSNPHIDHHVDPKIDPELADTEEQAVTPLDLIDAKVLTDPLVLRALGVIAVSMAIVFWPDRSTIILSRLVGLALVWSAGQSVLDRLRHHPIRWSRLVLAVLGIALGLFLVLSPDRSPSFLGRLIGISAILYALSVVRRWRTQDSETRAVALSTAVAVAAAGALLVLFPADVLGAITSLAAFGWILVSLLVIVASVDRRTHGTASYGDAVELIGQWLNDRPKSNDARQALYDKILYEGPPARQRIIRFFSLMSFAAVIASMGVITDSTAVVIGAMLIAPLMTPLMGMAISLVMGWPNRLSRSTVLALGGIGCAIGIGILLGLLEPTAINTATNSQILGRSTPTTADLITALAAGAAGAYGLSRPDVSDALPGVAIAISLVPPLTVVGIAYSQGDFAAGNGALLLFATNMLAILVMGGLTFIATGVTPISQVTANQERMKTSLAAVTVMAAVVLGGLMLNSSQLSRSLFEQGRLDATVQQWIGEDADHQVVSSTISGDNISIIVIGPSDGLGDVEQLADDLGDELGRAINVDVRLLVEERLTGSSASSGG